jgi:hypothetical protein
MLELHIRNITGTFEYSNYKWSATINGKVIEEGIIRVFERSRGWKELVKEIIESADDKSEVL